MGINIICAMSKSRQIGYQGKLLTHLPRDLKYFKHLTENQITIMGRVTYESILSQLGKPLPNRTNIVLTRDYNYTTDHDNVHVYNSIHDILDEYEQHGEGDIFVIGGEQIYSMFLPHADRLYLTIIDHEFPEADTYFPAISDNFKCISMISNKQDEKHAYDYHFLVYEKK